MRVEGGRLLVAGRDAEALAGIIARVLDDPRAAADVGEAGRAAALALSWVPTVGRTAA